MALGCAVAEPSERRPNVVLVVVDTLRADHLGAYGFGVATSPRIDRIAAEGAIFERAIAAAPSTLPSHAAILTSRYSREVGAGFATGEGRLGEVRTLATTFREAGYATGAFVGNVVLRRFWGFDRGFDVYDDELDRREIDRHRIRERVAEATTRRALDWISGVQDRPFLLWVHYQDPHGPYEAPPPATDRLQVPPVPGESPLPVLANRGGWNGIPAHQVLDGARLPSEYQSRYANEIGYTDHWIGVLIDAVDSHPSGRQVVFLLTSDHGESMGESGRWFTHSFATTPQLAHVPLIVRASGVPPSRLNETVGHVDIMPTLIELAGLEVPPGLRGLALGPLLREGAPLQDRWLYCDRGREISAYRGDGFVRGTQIESGRESEPGDSSNGSWERWAWEPDGSWHRHETDIEPAPAIRTFVRGAVPVQAVPLPPKIREELRALGYLDESPHDG